MKIVTKFQDLPYWIQWDVIKALIINTINNTPIKYPINFNRLGPVFHIIFKEKYTPIIKNNNNINEFLFSCVLETI